jgi:hypothetical protein
MVLATVERLGLMAQLHLGVNGTLASYSVLPKHQYGSTEKRRHAFVRRCNSLRRPIVRLLFGRGARLCFPRANRRLLEAEIFAQRLSGIILPE